MTPPRITTGLIDIPDIDAPIATLCWAQNTDVKHPTPTLMERCDRATGHGGLHSWQAWDEIQRLKAGT